jgi:hypothetical protein
MLADQADHVLGVDTHRDSHSTAILAADTAVVQGQITTAANERGYRRLLRYARQHAPGASCVGDRGHRQLRRRADRVPAAARRAGARDRPPPPPHTPRPRKVR